jgi:hypothetical protein
LEILCSGYLVRYPLGGMYWHHLQYLVGFQRLGHKVTYFEDFGWPNSCYDPSGDVMTAGARFGTERLEAVLQEHGLGGQWCFLAEDGAAWGMSRERLERVCTNCDVYFNLSNINWIPELEQCRRRILVDTDPVFTQIGAHGLGGPFSRYHALCTYGENAHQPGCTMPLAGARWLPTRQPVVLDLWPVDQGDRSAPFTTVMNWSPFGDCMYEERIYGQKDREFVPYFSLPREAGQVMELAVQAPREVGCRLRDGGWRIRDPREVTRSPAAYQAYLRASRAEFSVAKNGYVSTHCGWFSERSAAYLASGRPVVVQDTGFSDWLPTGAGVLAFRTPEEALEAIKNVNGRYQYHCDAARALAAEYFDARRVLSTLLDRVCL